MEIQYCFHMYIGIVCVMQILEICICHPLKLKNFLSQYKNHYDDDYGQSWIYFPDGNGIPHFVNLSSPEREMLVPRFQINSAIEYRLYSRNNTEDYIILNESGESLLNSNVREILKDIPLKIVTHGWKSSANHDIVIKIKNAYLDTHNVNVIGVDWSRIADVFIYPWVVYQTASVGSLVGLFIDSLNKHYNITGDRIHLIGHSLGAHVFGIAASESHQKIARITGLDPARPLFDKRDDSLKLNLDDATFVDVIHTCGGLLGVEKAVGNADFYPNSGMPPQPGCENIQKIFETCSHGRAHAYYAESIRNPKAFPAYVCNSWSEFLRNQCKSKGYMGDGADSKHHGKFYLKTNSMPPFGIH